MLIEGQHLGDFEILEQLGQGGMGAVYKARQVSLDRLVALKTLQGALASDPEYIARFRREAKAAAALNHPNLVQVYAAGENDGLHWFAMEYVEGESAQTRVKRKGRLDPLEAIAIATHVCRALDYAWRKAQLIHRDIKPDNIFLSTDGEVKLGDLGLAKSAGETQSLTTTGSSMGTPHYVSPEQAQGKKDVDLRADIYSLGCTVFHLVSGEAPYKGDSALAVMMKHVSAPVPNLRSVWPEGPPELSAVVMKMMLKPPDARQQSYEEAIADLRRAYDALTGASMPSMLAVTQQPAARNRAKQQPPPARKPAVAEKRTPATALAVTGLALLAAAAALFYFAPWEKGDAGGTRSVVSPSSPNPAGKAGADGAAARPSSVLPDSPPPPRPSSVQTSATPEARATSGAALVGSESSFSPLFDANGIRDWRPHGSGGEWDFAGGVLSVRITTKSTTRLRCPQSLASADFEVRFAVRGDRGPAFEFRGDAGEKADCYVFDPTNLRTRGSVFWDGTQNGKFAKAGQRIRITRDDQREELTELTALPQWKDGDWNEVTLTIQGDHFSGTCNGVLVAEVTDESSSYRAGRREFGFRMSNNADAERLAEFKDIRIKRLPAAPVAKVTTIDRPAPAKGIIPGTYPQPVKWIDGTPWLRANNSGKDGFVAEGEWLRFPGNARMFILTPGQQFRNPIVRVRYSGRVDIALRTMRKGGDDLRYEAGVGPAKAYIQMIRPAGSREPNLLTPYIALDPSYRPDEEYEAVFAAQGSTLTLWIDGRKIVSAQDSTLATGELAFLMKNNAQNGNCLIRKVEYGELPDATPAPARLTPAAEPWQDVLWDPAKLVLTGAVKRTPEGLRFTDVGGAMRAPGDSPQRDGAVRMTATFGGLRTQLLARNTKTAGMYQLYALDAKTITFNRWDQAAHKSITLHGFPLREPLQLGQDYELELRAVGQNFTAKLNGEILGTVTDGALSQGPFGVGVTVHDATPVLVKALEVLDLDTPATAAYPQPSK